MIYSYILGGQNPTAESLNTTAIDNQLESVKIHTTTSFRVLERHRWYTQIG